MKTDGTEIDHDDEDEGLSPPSDEVYIESPASPAGSGIAKPPSEIEIAKLLNDEAMLPAGRDILRRLACQRDDLLRLVAASPDRHVAALEKFMMVVASRLKCLPSFADPSPDEGNSHIIRKLDKLIESASDVINHIGAHGEIDSRHPLTEKLLDVLSDIKGL